MLLSSLFFLLLLSSCSDSEESSAFSKAYEALNTKDNTNFEKLVVSHPDIVKKKVNDNHTLLSWAIYRGNEKAIVFLLDKGADIHIRTTSWRLRPIDWAAFRYDDSIYKLLKSRGAQDDAITLVLKGTTQEVKEFYAKNKVSRNYCWGNNTIPVTAAIYAKKPETLKFLLQQGFPVIIPEKNISALRIAILTSSPQALDILLEHEISHNSMPSEKEREYLFNIIRYAKKEKRKEIETVLASHIPKTKIVEKKENNRSADVLKPLTID